MTTGTPAAIAPVGLPDLSTDLISELRRKNLISGDVAYAQGTRGPLLTRWALGDNGGHHLWVDEPGPLTSTALSAVQPPRHVRVEEMNLPNPVRLTRGVAWSVPWRPCLLADTDSWSGSWTNAAPDQHVIAGASVGRFLRRLHAMPPPDRGPGAGVITRLMRADVDTLAMRPKWRDRITSLAEHARQAPARIHGEPASGHLLVPAYPDERGPRTSLLGWTAPILGAAALDVGYLIGDLLELSVFCTSRTCRVVLRRMASGVRQGYLASGPVPHQFWYHAATGAVVKILDHELRLRRAGFTVDADTSLALNSLAQTLIDATSTFGAYLAPVS